MSDELEPDDGEADVMPQDKGGTDADPKIMGEDAAGIVDLAGEVSDEISSRQVDVLSAANEIPPHSNERRSAFMGVPIEVTVSIGRARPLVSELIKLRRDSVLTLDSKIEDPVELFIGDRLIARGELQEMDDETGKLGVRLTEVADLSSGV